MSTVETEDKLASAKEQGQAQFDSIKEMVEALHHPNDAARENPNYYEDAERAIHEDALSVEVRSDWYTPGQLPDARSPSEYRILLCTGGPAVQIIGELNEHREPETARLQVQDWFQPWTDYRPINPDDHTFTTRIDTKAEEILLAYARCFYFGE
jgi:hypothetical protein